MRSNKGELRGWTFYPVENAWLARERGEPCGESDIDVIEKSAYDSLLAEAEHLASVVERYLDCGAVDTLRENDPLNEALARFRAKYPRGSEWE